VEITSMNDSDRLLYVSFLERVAQRTVRQVIVAATPSRATQLVKSLSAAGYVVTSGSDPRMLVRLAELDGTPPDIAVFDDALGDGEESRWLRQVLKGRGVPCVAISRESGERARSAVDAMLDVD
jgi:DNA-binding response OmpR family regulator